MTAERLRKLVMAAAKGIKPPAAGKGRAKGVPNKLTREVKSMVLEALDGAGGIGYLIERAQDPRTASAFLTLVGKVIPLQLQGSDDPNAPAVKHHLTLEFVDARPVPGKA